jgi:hypothetical protein
MQLHWHCLREMVQVVVVVVEEYHLQLKQAAH